MRYRKKVRLDGQYFFYTLVLMRQQEVYLFVSILFFRKSWAINLNVGD